MLGKTQVMPGKLYDKEWEEHKIADSLSLEIWRNSLDVMVQGLNSVLFCKFFFRNNFKFMEEL